MGQKSGHAGAAYGRKRNEGHGIPPFSGIRLRNDMNERQIRPDFCPSYESCFKATTVARHPSAVNLTVRLRDLLGVFSDQAGLGDVTGTGLSGWLIFGQGGLGGEPLG